MGTRLWQGYGKLHIGLTDAICTNVGTLPFACRKAMRCEEIVNPQSVQGYGKVFASLLDGNNASDEVSSSMESDFA